MDFSNMSTTNLRDMAMVDFYNSQVYWVGLFVALCVVGGTQFLPYLRKSIKVSGFSKAHSKSNLEKLTCISVAGPLT